MVPILAGIFLYILRALGQRLSVPTEWRLPTSTLSWEQRSDLALSLLNTMEPLFSIAGGNIGSLTFGQNGHMISSFALYDLAASTQTFNGLVSTWLGADIPSLSQVSRCPDVSSENIAWGIAGANAYRAYGLSQWRDFAATIWNQINDRCIITAADAKAGTHPTKNVTFPSQCSSNSVVDGVFLYGNNPTNLWVNMDAIGGFMELSALLYEATNNQTYADSARGSFRFIRKLLYDGSLIQDRIDLGTCKWIDLQSSNSGYAIEAVSIYASKTNDTDATTFLKDLVPTAMKYAGWTGYDGIVTEGPTLEAVASTTDGFNLATANRGTYIRGLHEAWSRMDKGSELAQLIESYVMVQYNALLDLAKSSDHDWYSPRWGGPAATMLLPWGQFIASNVFNSAFSMANSTTSGTGTSNQPKQGLPKSPTSTNLNSISKGAIIGLSISAAVIAVLLVGFIAYSIIRWRRGKEIFAWPDNHVTLTGDNSHVQADRPGPEMVSSSMPLVTQGSATASPTVSDTNDRQPIAGPSSLASPSLPVALSSRAQDVTTSNNSSVTELTEGLQHVMAREKAEAHVSVPYQDSPLSNTTSKKGKGRLISTDPPDK